MTELSDAELMRATAQGDDHAFQQLVERHQREVYGTLVKMLGDATEAEDLAMRVFMRVYKAAGSYQPSAKFKTWLFTILRNLVFNEYRRRGRATLFSMDATDSDENESPREYEDAAQRGADENLLQREKFEAIDRAIRDLPEQQRLAVLLKSHQDMSYEEIAEVLKTSVSATKSLLFRARDTLKKQLADFFDKNAD